MQSQPEIAHAIRADQLRIGRRNAKFLVQSAAERYRLTTAQAQLAVSMSSGASIAAAELAASAKLDRAETIELAVNYILSGIERITGSEA